MFNGDRQVTAWVTARGYFQAALRDALIATNLDCTAFITNDGMSLGTAIEIVGAAIRPVDDGS